MKKVLKFIGNVIFFVFSLILIVYIAGMHFFPEQLKNITGYQTFVILTDSMEPTIPVGSLVVSRNIDDDEVIPKDTIISFRVKRFGEKVVFTHYFKKLQLDDTGRMRYLTQAENANRYDDYVTYREDILGTYVLHVPYIGKVVLFLQSPFALIELGIILFIILINRILWNKFDREEKEALAAGEEEEDIVDAEEINEIEADMKSEDVPQLSLEEALDLTEGNPDILPEDESESTVAEEVDTQGVKEESIQESMPASIPVEESEVVKVIEVEEALETSAEDTEAAISLPEIIVENPREKQKDKKSDKKQKKDKKKKKKKDKKKSKKKK